MTEFLYLFGYSLRNSTQFKQLIPLIKSQLTKGLEVDLIFLHDAVIGTSTKANLPKLLKELLDFAFQMKNVGEVSGIEPGVKLHTYVLQPDYEARGFQLENLSSNLEFVSYEQLVDRMDAANKLVSWM
jgi:hypothetical protein